jgi:hypothetical protein
MLATPIINTEKVMFFRLIARCFVTSGLDEIFEMIKTPMVINADKTNREIAGFNGIFNPFVSKM